MVYSVVHSKLKIKMNLFQVQVYFGFVLEVTRTLLYLFVHKETTTLLEFKLQYGSEKTSQLIGRDWQGTCTEFWLNWDRFLTKPNYYISTLMSRPKSSEVLIRNVNRQVWIETEWQFLLFYLMILLNFLNSLMNFCSKLYHSLS